MSRDEIAGELSEASDRHDSRLHHLHQPRSAYSRDDNGAVGSDR